MRSRRTARRWARSPGCAGAGGGDMSRAVERASQAEAEGIRADHADRRRSRRGRDLLPGPHRQGAGRDRATAAASPEASSGAAGPPKPSWPGARSSPAPTAAPRTASSSPTRSSAPPTGRRRGRPSTASRRPSRPSSATGSRRSSPTARGSGAAPTASTRPRSGLTTTPAGVLNNWGYSKLTRGDAEAAERLFTEAITYDRDLFTAKNNLVLARAARRESTRCPSFRCRRTSARSSCTPPGSRRSSGATWTWDGPCCRRPSTRRPRFFEAAVRALEALDA